MSKLIEQLLTEVHKGIYIAPTLGELIVSKEKSLIIKEREYSDEVGRTLYLISNKLCYGVIRLKTPDKINIVEFNELADKHKINNFDRKKWWPNKEVLFAYPFDIIKLFEVPIPIELPLVCDTFINNFKFPNQLDLSTRKVIIQEQILTQKEVDTNLITPFTPMRVNQKFNELDAALKYMFSIGSKYAIEKKYVGTRAVLIKSGHSIKIFSDTRLDVSTDYPDIASEVRKLSTKDFVLDAIGKDTQMVVFDILYLGSDLTDRPWEQRKSLLHSLRFTDHIKEAHSIIIESALDASKAISLLMNMDDSEGVVIKRYDGLYQKDCQTNDWLTLIEMGSTTTGTPGISDVSGKKWIKKKIAGPKRLEDMTDQEKKEYNEAIILLKKRRISGG